MKKFLMYTMLYWFMTDLCAHANLNGNDSSTAFAEALPRALSRRILGVMPSDNALFMIITAEEHAPPFETCLRVITCKLDGNVLEQSKLITEGYFAATNDPKVPLIGIHTPLRGESKGLWLVKYDGRNLQQKFFLIDKTEEEAYSSKCWLIDVGREKKLFVEKHEFKKVQVKGRLELVPKYWLHCYAMENDSLKLEGKALIAEGKTESNDFSVECVLIGGEVYAWVCEEGWSTGLLRMAKWQNNGELKWIECYKTKIGRLLRGLIVDRLNGTAAAIFEYQRERWDSLATFCRFEDNTSSCVELGRFPSAPTKYQLLGMSEPNVAWLLVNYHLWEMHIVTLDGKLQVTGERHREFPHTTDLHLVRGSDQALYIVTVTEDGQIKIEKIEDLAKAKHIP